MPLVASSAAGDHRPSAKPQEQCRCCCLQAALPVHHELRRAPIRPSLNRQDAASTRRHPSSSNRVCAAPPSFASVHSLGLTVDVCLVLLGFVKDAKTRGLLVLLCFGTPSTSTPKTRVQLLTPVDFTKYLYRRPEHLRNVYNYRRRVPLLPLPPTCTTTKRVRLLPLRPVNDYFPRRF